ncbi:MAG: tetratricopeptide repeat protein [Bdellovibrionales bacterium]
MRCASTRNLKQLCSTVLAYNYLLILASCAMVPPSSKFEVTTEPIGANVILITDSGSESSLGTTPMTIPEEILNRQDRLMRIQLAKSGFVKEQVVVDVVAVKARGKLHVNMTPMANWMEAYQDNNAQKYLEDVAAMAAEIQGATVRGDFAKAERLGRAMVTRYPKLATGWSLIGNIYYLQKRMGDALDAYSRSLALNPDNQDTKSVIERIKNASY